MPRKPHSHHYLYRTTNLINGKFYIGVHSTSNLEDGYLGSGTYLKRSIKKYGKENFKLEILEFFDSRDKLIEAEKNSVDEILVKHPLCMNLMIGGSASGPFSEERRNKISQAGKGRKASTEQRLKIAIAVKKAHAEKKGWFGDPERLKKIGDGNRGKKMSDESKAKLSEASKGNTSHLGHKHSEESKARMSKIKIGKPVSDITRKKLSKAGSGRKVSDEIKRHLSEINTGKTLSDEHKLKLSEAHLGMKFSEEHRKKIGDAHRGKSKKEHLIHQLELDGTFIKTWTSLLDLTACGFHGSNVTACCSGKKKSAYGYKWNY